ncbi:MAG: HlyD family secretion protein [Pseudomonadota bacterium]|jgi:membrane fusion protein (multidrug efflux system)|nr:HlyD family secretion protein [Pseudomonadota bacterium]
MNDSGHDAPSEHESPSATRPLRERLRRPLLWGVPAIVIAGALYLYLTSGRYQSTDDAYLRAAEVQISADVSGRVVQVDVHDNEPVKQGQVLFRLDPRRLRIAVAAARSRLAAARLAVRALEADYRADLAALNSAKSRQAYARRELLRRERLLKIGVSSTSQFDRARLAWQQSQAAVSAAQQQTEAVLARLGGNPALPVSEHPQVAEAQAMLDHALLELSYATVRAPTDGIVTEVDHLQVGGYLPLATPAFVLVSTHDVWIEADYKENQLTHIRPGDRATVNIDAYPDQTFHAVVSSITPGTGAQFSVLPPQNATGNWVKVVQRLDVRLRLVGQMPPVRSGLSASVTIDTQSGPAARHGSAAAAG